MAITAVIGHDKQIGAGIVKFFLEDDQVFVFETNDEVDFYAHVMQSFSLRISNSNTQAATDNADFFQSFEFRWNAQWADEIEEAVAFVEFVQSISSVTNFLEDDGHSASFSVVASDSQRDSFSVFVNAEHNELTWLSFLGNMGSQDLHVGHGWVQNPFFDDWEHGYPP